MRSLNEWILTYDGKSMLSLKTASNTRLIPFKIDRPYLATILDPYDKIHLDYTSRKLLNKYDCRVPKLGKGQTAPLFSEPLSATMVLRALLTPNLYVFAKQNYPTNALVILEEKEIEPFLEIIEIFGLCGVVYSPHPRPGFNHINLNYEERRKN